MRIKKARTTFSKAFKKDPDFRLGYQANVAMLLRDRYTGKYLSFKTANKAASDILDLIFED